jgi:hypothetical protein
MASGGRNDVGYALKVLHQPADTYRNSGRGVTTTQTQFLVPEELPLLQLWPRKTVELGKLVRFSDLPSPARLILRLAPLVFIDKSRLASSPFTFT